MPLQKRVKQAVDARTGKEEQKKSKRQRIAEFFRSRKQKKEEKPADTPQPIAISGPQKPLRDSKIAESAKPADSSVSIDKARAPAGTEEQTQLPTPPSERDTQGEKDHDAPQEAVEELQQQEQEKREEYLDEDRIQTIFSGAPHFGLKQKDGRSVPGACFPWDEELSIKDVSDSLQLAQPAFSAATLHRHLPKIRGPSEQDKVYQAYDVGVVEVPSMLSAQGIEPGSIGFQHFLELPTSDNLVTDLQESQSSNGYLEGVRNREQFQSKPEKLGIRKMDMNLVYDRLVELGDLIEVFQDSPERMTILNNQSSGDLYANLFGKFLAPPRYDDSADDPTGIKVQIDTLVKILRLRGFWYDLSLVEWRIRIGQILWSDADTIEDEHSDELWTGRDIVLLQILLACELLLRLDAAATMEVDDITDQMHIVRDDYMGFLKLKTKKVDWDLIFARRFLDNILVVKEGGANNTNQTPRTRGLLSLLSRDQPHDSSSPDIVPVPRHQARQLSGLVHFADSLRWPGVDLIIKQLSQKLGLPIAAPETQEPSSPYGKFLDVSTPSSVSVYGTPLATPRSVMTVRDSYFGHIAKPNRHRSNTQNSLKIPLSAGSLEMSADTATGTANIGGWLSRSYLTGLVLPGEAIAHFLMSTLLENDRLAITALGDSANLYGGFVYGDRCWWSKSSIVGRVLACLDGAVECMGWISIPRLPLQVQEGWYAVDSEQLPPEQPVRIKADDDLISRDSALFPNEDEGKVKAEDLTLPADPPNPPVPSIEFARWDLASSEKGYHDQDDSSSVETSDSHKATLVFTSFSRNTTHSLTLAHDVQYVTSFPCSPPSRSPQPNFPQILKAALSRTSSKRSIHSTKSASNKRMSRNLSRRNSHGYSPLLSHPPDSPGLAPTRVYSPIPDDEGEEHGIATPKAVPMMAHPLHISYKYKFVPATDVLDPNFIVPFNLSTYHPSSLSAQSTPREEKKEPSPEEKMILVLDARSSKDLELLARAWCAEKGLHAIIGRVGRTCLACCIREARGLGVGVVIRT